MSTRNKRRGDLLKEIGSLLESDVSLTLSGIYKLYDINHRIDRERISRLYKRIRGISVSSTSTSGVKSSSSRSKDRRVRSGSDGVSRSSKPLIEFETKIKLKPSGNGAVWLGSLELNISSRHTGHSLTGDIVLVSAVHTSEGEYTDLRVERVVERCESYYVGEVQLSEETCFVITNRRLIPVDIYISREGRSGFADILHNGDKVKVRVVSWDDADKNPAGVIVKHLGVTGDNETEMSAIMEEYNLPYEFSEEVLNYALHLRDTVDYTKLDNRRDFRSVTTFTIDPFDAKDFDDALSIRRLNREWIEVGVHIADVSYFLQEGSVLDSDARDRGTSVYLVDRCVPMLPEVLSNELCSLNPNEDKFCFAMVFEINVSTCEIRESWIGRTVINSNRRYSYEEAGEIIDKCEGDYCEQLTVLNDVAKRLRVKRFEKGAIDFEKEETKFRLDSNGSPIGIYVKKSGDTNKMIEEYMLLANRGVALFLSSHNKHRDNIYRVHPAPTPEKLSIFKDFILKFGYSFKTDDRGITPRVINDLLISIQGKRESNIISTLAVRSMQKAIYSTENTGHYGLSFDHYTHFTSPIRRYPDVLVHRLLGMLLEKKSYKSLGELGELCVYCSEREKVASEAERSSIKLKMAEYYADRVGEVYVGILSNITTWGCFIEIPESLAEGSVPFSSIQGEYCTFDSATFSFSCSVSKRVFTIGDEVEVRIREVDIRNKQIYYDIVELSDTKSS